MTKLEIVTADPLKILSATRSVVEHAQHVSLRVEKLEPIIQEIVALKERGQTIFDEEYRISDDFEENAHATFLYVTTNFCFWPDAEQTKWEVVSDKGARDGGAHGLLLCFWRALEETPELLTAQALITLSDKAAAHLFRGADDIQIPMLAERAANLREAGHVLQEKFGGRFMHVLEAAHWDVIQLVQLIAENFPSFQDISHFDGVEVPFLKRAQLIAGDIDRTARRAGRPMTSGADLTAFADYKIPQILRAFDILEYSPALSQKVDAFELIPHDSREEIEIRAATVWAVELLRQHIHSLAASTIDNLLWLLSQDGKFEARLKPYHRTRTIFY